MHTIQGRRHSGVRRLTVLALFALVAVFAALSTAHGAKASGPGTLHGCPPGRLCLYKGKYWNNGNQKPDAVYYHCGDVNLKGWTSRHGSYLDNQTGNPTTAFFAGYGGSGKILRTTTPLRTGKSTGYDSDFNFYPVNSIRVC